MTTLNLAALTYKLYNRCDESDDLKSRLYTGRTLDIICSIERLCYKIAKAVLRHPEKVNHPLKLKNKQSDWIRDKRIWETALKILKLKYGEISISSDQLTVSIRWQSHVLPKLNEKDHLNTKLFQAIIGNRYTEAKKLLCKGADANYKGPFGKRPLHAVQDNRNLFKLLINCGADPEIKDDSGKKCHHAQASRDALEEESETN